MTFSGTQAAINTALNGLSYTPTANFNGSASLQIVTSDGTLSDSDTVGITVNAVNDPPVLTGDLSATVAEGGTYVIMAADLGFSDPDDDASGVTFTVSNQVNGGAGRGRSGTTFTGSDLATGIVTFVHNGGDDQCLVPGGRGGRQRDLPPPTPQTFTLNVSG
jgi:hypothetical protein